jgi:tellurite resistance protein TehA-like permease
MSPATGVGSNSSPVWFSGVMATGIVALALRDAGLAALSWALAALGAAAWLALLAILFCAEAWTGSSAQRALERFAFVAATSVLASLAPAPGIAVCLLVLATGAWCTFLPGAIATQFGPAGARARQEARGSWLLAAVGIESLAVTAAEVGRRYGGHAIILLAGLWWLLGLCVYAALVRILLPPLLRRTGVDELTGDHWILMGALAISALASGRVYAAIAARRLDPGLLPILHAGSIACWVGAVCWLPLLAAAESRGGRDRFQYRVPRWSTVFPLGMLAAASHALTGTFGFGPGRWVFDVLVWVATAVWFAVSLGFVRAVGQRASAERR